MIYRTWTVYFFALLLFSLLSAGEDPSAIELKKIEHLHNQDRLKQAENRIWTALEKFPHSYLKADYLLLLASTFLKNNDPEQAQIILKGMDQMWPAIKDDPNKKILTSAVQFQLGEVEQALTPVIDATDPDGMFQAAAILEQSNQSFAAVTQLASLMKSHSTSTLAAPAQIALAQSHVSLNELDTAESVLSTTLTNDGHYQNARRYLLALTAYFKRDYASSLADLNKMDPTLPQWRSYQALLSGLTAKETGDINQAIAHFKSNLNSADKFCLIRSAVECTGLYLHQQKWEEAFQTLTSVMHQMRNPKDRIPFLLMRGLVHQHQGKPTAAIRDFEQAAYQQDPAWTPKALLFMGHVLWQTNRLSRLTTDFSEEINRADARLDGTREELEWARFLVGDALYQMRLYQKAADQFESVLRTSPESSLMLQSVSGVIACYIKLNKLEKAVQKIEELSVRFGEIREVIRYTLLAQGNLFWHQEKYKQARLSYEKFLDLFPQDKKSAFVLYQLGRIDEKRGLVESSIVTRKKIWSDHPDSPYAYKGMMEGADLLKREGRASESTALYALLHKNGRTKTAETALLNLGFMALETHQPLKAIQIYDQFLKDYPHSSYKADVLNGLQTAYQITAVSRPNQLDELASTYNNQFHAGEAFFQMGLAKLKENKITGARGDFTTIISTYALSPSAGLALYYKGQCEYRSGDFESALISLSQFARQHPDHDFSHEARYYRGRALMNIGNYEEAVLSFNQMIERDPHSYFAGSATLQKAHAFQKLKKSADEFSAYQLFVDQFSHRREVNRTYYRMATIKKEQGELAAALIWLNKVKPESGFIEKKKLNDIRTQLARVIENKRTNK